MHVAIRGTISCAERISEAELTGTGLVGDRAYALVETETAKVVSAKTPRVGPQLLGCRAAFLEAPRAGDESPPVRITLPDGTTVTSDGSDADLTLSAFLGWLFRPVRPSFSLVVSSRP